MEQTSLECRVKMEESSGSTARPAPGVAPRRRLVYTANKPLADFLEGVFDPAIQRTV